MVYSYYSILLGINKEWTTDNVTIWMDFKGITLYDSIYVALKVIRL